MPNHKSTLQFKALLLLALQLIVSSGCIYAFESDFYATSSVLSQGNWAKIGVDKTGVQFVSDATLRNLGFADPSKVNVYGYGGAMIPENLNSPDDLPLVPSIRTNGGLLFFGRNSVSWKLNSNATSVYSHQGHPYSDAAYYFVSDFEGRHIEPEKISAGTTPSGKVITEFTERLVHEQDLFMPMNTGRLMLGEDFKASPSRSFQFNLKGNKGDATVTTAFGSKTSAGTSSIILTANGKMLESTSSDQMAFSSSKEIVTTTTTKVVNNPGENLDINIRFNGSGNILHAALDYIEVEYPRDLDLGAGELYFYISPGEASIVRVTGASASTVVWDVTDPANHFAVPVTFGNNAVTFIAENGAHEFVAFEPGKITRAAQPGEKVANQDIHSMPAPGLLVITPAEFIPAAQRLEALHQKTDGLSVAILTPEVIYNEFSSGKPDVTAFRKLLKMWYDRAEGKAGEYTGYCVIMSRPTYDNKAVSAAVKNCGYPRIPIWQSATGETQTTSYSTDDYIGMLADVNGSFNIGTAHIHAAVGRMPVKTLNEANIAIDKLEEYLLNPDLGAWRNNVIIIADDQDSGVHLEQAEKVYTAMVEGDLGKNFIYEKLYLDSYPLEYTGVGASYPQARERLLNKWNEGTAFINYVGHANPKSWGHEYLLTWNDITTMSNSRLPYIYAATCEFMRWDDDEISGAEVLWLYPNSGVIGMICPSREVLISANGVLNKSTSSFVFMTDDEGKPLRVGDVMIKGKNDSNTGTNKLRYGLLGDPSMRLPWPQLKVEVDKINGVELANAEELPVLSARSSAEVSGHISDDNGNLLSDFNGIVEIALYDAEKVIITNGNGKEGVQSEYNDRKTRLFVGRTKVTDGKWSVNFTMPSEIENNYSPALLSLYAYDENAREANGYSESLYAYGYDENAPDDFEGPKFIEFYLNSPNFSDGSQISPNPVLVAKFYDESGISVSEAGIGHNISLDLDNKTFFDDVAQYYIPDEEDARAGSLTYSLGEIAQGDHVLRFTVWDNANNSTTGILRFSISALWKPTIELLTTDVNPATSSVNFIIGTDGTSNTMECSVEVYDIWGRRVWYSQAPSLVGNVNRTSINWDLNDFGGGRVSSGIYLYRATIKMANGATVAKTKKLVVK